MKSILHESNNKDILHSNVLHLHDFRLMKTTLIIMTIIEVNDGQGDGPDQQANQQTFIGPLKGPKTLSFNFLGAWLWPATGFSFINLVFGSSKPFIVGHKEFMCVQKTWIWPPLAMSLWIIVLDPSGPFQSWPTQNFKDKAILFCDWKFCESQQNFKQVFGIFGNGGP